MNYKIKQAIDKGLCELNRTPADLERAEIYGDERSNAEILLDSLKNSGYTIVKGWKADQLKKAS